MDVSKVGGKRVSRRKRRGLSTVSNTRGSIAEGVVRQGKWWSGQKREVVSNSYPQPANEHGHHYWWMELAHKKEGVP